MPTIVVKDDEDFATQLASAGNKLIVLDFTASWCGPCQMMAPVFDQLANQYLNVAFLKVDVDKCQDSAASYGVSAMPTFMIYQNGQKLETLRGANKEGLEQLVKKHAEASQAPSMVTGQIDLTPLIDRKQMECLNESDGTPLERFLDGNTNLVSDCDEQLIISLPFVQPVKVHSILVKGKDDRTPKNVKVFSNLPKTLDFDNASGLEPIQTLVFNETASQGDGQVQQLKYVKFQNVQNIQFFVENNLGEGEVTELVYLKVFGTPLSAVNMSDFKRVAGKAGDAH